MILIHVINFNQIIGISNYDLTVCPALFASINGAYNTHTEYTDDLIKCFAVV